MLDHLQHSTLVSFIWNIADDVLRDVYKRGHYRDVILPMTVIRRLDAMLEESKEDVLAEHATLNELGLSRDEQDGPLRKAENRRSKVQLIDASSWFKLLRKNQGKKNCELSEEDRQHIVHTFLAFVETEQSMIFPNQAFGYWKITVERPLRLRVDLSSESLARFRAACHEAKEEPLIHLAHRVLEKRGAGPHLDYNAFLEAVQWDADHYGLKMPAKRLKLLQSVLGDPR